MRANHLLQNSRVGLYETQRPQPNGGAAHAVQPNSLVQTHSCGRGGQTDSATTPSLRSMLEAKYVERQDRNRAERQECKVGRADKHRARVAEELLKDSPNRRTLTKSLGVLQRMSTHEYVDYADAKLWSAGAGAANNAKMRANISKLAGGSSGNPLELPAFKRTMLLQIKISLLDHRPASTPSVSWGQLPTSSKPSRSEPQPQPQPQPPHPSRLTTSKKSDSADSEGASEREAFDDTQSTTSHSSTRQPILSPRPGNSGNLYSSDPIQFRPSNIRTKVVIEDDGDDSPSSEDDDIRLGGSTNHEVQQAVSQLGQKVQPGNLNDSVDWKVSSKEDDDSLDPADGHAHKGHPPLMATLSIDVEQEADSDMTAELLDIAADLALDLVDLKLQVQDAAGAVGYTKTKGKSGEGHQNPPPVSPNAMDI